MRVKVLVLQAPPLTVAVAVAAGVHGGSLPEVPSTLLGVTVSANAGPGVTVLKRWRLRCFKTELRGCVSSHNSTPPLFMNPRVFPLESESAYGSEAAREDRCDHSQNVEGAHVAGASKGPKSRPPIHCSARVVRGRRLEINATLGAPLACIWLLALRPSYS